ncbi:MAG: alpha/beta hydrolase [Nocardioides sp.]
MSTPTRVDFSSGDLTIAAYRWQPEGPPTAIAQLTHGMGEHAQRYGHLARTLNRQGYVVYAQDHRGHGQTAPAIEDLGRVGSQGWTELVADIGRLSAVAKAAHPGLPLVLFGHSMGSFATQQWLLDHSHEVDAVALSGTAALDLLEPALDLDAPLELAMFNAPFAPARTDYDWLSRDEGEVDKYVDDPFCGFGLDGDGAKQMFVGARAMAQAQRVGAIRKDLPIYIAVGDQDPVNGRLALAQGLVDRYTAAGLTDVTYKIYPGARHEILNETNRDQVEADLVGWIGSRI